MTDSINANDFDPPLTGKQVEQVQEAINEALRRRVATEDTDIARRVQEGIAAELEARKAAAVMKSVASYNSGDVVDVIKDGEWRKGTVNGVEKKLGMVYVHTERGPVTIASARSIRDHQPGVRD